MPDPTLPALSPEERSKIRHHMGYPQLQTVSTFVLGTPASIEVDFLIERAMDMVSPGLGLERLREYICHMDKCECTMGEALENSLLESVNNIKFNDKALERIESVYGYWQQKMIDALGVPAGPIRFRTRGTGMGGGLSVPVG